MHKRTALLNAFLFFMIWLAILYAGADHPPPPGFVFVVLLDLAGIAPQDAVESLVSHLWTPRHSVVLPASHDCMEISHTCRCC